MANEFNISDVPAPVGPKSVSVPTSIADGTLGELLTWDAAGLASLVPAGAAGFVLTANGATPPTFQAAGGAPVSSVFGRVGAVVAVAGDYSFPLITGTITDAQHAARGGGTLHAAVIAGGAAGFMTGADKTKLDGIAAGAQVNTVTSVFGRVGAVVAVAGDYTTSLVTNASAVAGATSSDALNNLRNAAAQARRTTTLALTTAFADIDLNATDVETNSAIIDHLAGTPDRISFVVAGLYLIHWHFRIEPIGVTNSTALIEGRVRVNDTTVLNGSNMNITNFDDNSIEGNDFQGGLGASFLYQAAASDFITLQARYVQVSSNNPTPTMSVNTIMTAIRVTQ